MLGARKFPVGPSMAATSSVVFTCFDMSNLATLPPLTTITRLQLRASFKASAGPTFCFRASATSEIVTLCFARNPCDLAQPSQLPRW